MKSGVRFHAPVPVQEDHAEEADQRDRDPRDQVRHLVVVRVEREVPALDVARDVEPEGEGDQEVDEPGEPDVEPVGGHVGHEGQAEHEERREHLRIPSREEGDRRRTPRSAPGRDRPGTSLSRRPSGLFSLRLFLSFPLRRILSAEVHAPAALSPIPVPACPCRWTSPTPSISVQGGSLVPRRRSLGRSSRREESAISVPSAGGAAPSSPPRGRPRDPGSHRPAPVSGPSWSVRAW